MNSTDNTNMELLKIIADNLSLIEKHFYNISCDINFITRNLEESTPKIIKELSHIKENTGNIV